MSSHTGVPPLERSGLTKGPLELTTASKCVPCLMISIFLFRVALFNTELSCACEDPFSGRTDVFEPEIVLVCNHGGRIVVVLLYFAVFSHSLL